MSNKAVFSLRQMIFRLIRHVLYASRSFSSIIEQSRYYTIPCTMDKPSPLLNLPTEVFLHICEFLDAKTLSQSLRFVCKRFYSILEDKSIWKQRIKRNIINKFPSLPVDENEFDWMKSCCAIESEYITWKKFSNKEYTQHIHKCDPYSLLLINAGSLCVTGSYDHSISLWNIKKDPVQEVVLSGQRFKAHRATIMELLYKDSKLFSCSSDNTVAYWDISIGIRNVDMADCHNPVICMATTDESPLVAAGLESGEIMLFDARTKLAFYKRYFLPKSSIFSMAMYGNTLVSGDDYGHIIAWDMRADKQMANINIGRRTDGHVTSIAYGGYVLYVGDSGGHLHLVHPKEIKVMHSYKLNDFSELTFLKFTGGCIIAVCEDMFWVSSLTLPPELITDLSGLYNPGGVYNKTGAFDYMNGVLAVRFEPHFIKFIITND